MRGIGALLTLYGFLSAVLYFVEYQIDILSWANKWQPGFGLIVGCVGMVFLGISLWTHKDDSVEPQPGGPYATPGGPPMAAPMAGPGPSPNRVPQQGPQFGPRPPQGPPQQGRPPQYPPPRPPNPLPPGGPTGFGPQGGPPYGPRG